MRGKYHRKAKRIKCCFFAIFHQGHPPIKLTDKISYLRLDPICGRGRGKREKNFSKLSKLITLRADSHYRGSLQLFQYGNQIAPSLLRCFSSISSNFTFKFLLKNLGFNLEFCRFLLEFSSRAGFILCICSRTVPCCGPTTERVPPH